MAIEEFSDSNFFLEVDKDTGYLKWRWLQYGGTVYLACEVRVMIRHHRSDVKPGRALR